MGELKASKNTRPYRAGLQVGEGLVESTQIMYLLDNKHQYLTGLEDAIKIGLANTEKEVTAAQVLKKITTQSKEKNGKG